MKKKIHPSYSAITVKCRCNNSFPTRSTIVKNFNIDICDQCHPFYSGKQRLIDTKGRISDFNKKYSKFQKNLFKKIR